MTKFDPTKPVQTRGGRKARIIATDAKGPYPIVALVDSGCSHESAESYTNDGRYFDDDVEKNKLDLINAHERESRWLVIMSMHAALLGQYTTKPLGRPDAASVEIIYENGIPVDVKLHHLERSDG